MNCQSFTDAVIFEIGNTGSLCCDPKKHPSVHEYYNKKQNLQQKPLKKLYNLLNKQRNTICLFEESHQFSFSVYLNAGYLQILNSALFFLNCKYNVFFCGSLG